MSQQATNLNNLFLNRIGSKKQKIELGKVNTMEKFNAKVGEVRKPVSRLNAKVADKKRREKSHYRGIVSRTWVLSNSPSFASF